jgi:NAD(P)H-quinone oxidoreductase subunit 5
VALLHILGHSLYKAHAFLSSGSAVEQWRDRFLAPKVPPPSKVTSTATTAAAGLGSVAFAMVMHPLATALLPILPLAPREEGSSLGASVAPSLVLGLAVAPLVARSLALPWLPRLALLGQSVAMICLGFALHGLAGHLCPSPSLEGSARWVAEAGWMGTATCFVLLAYLTSPTRTGASKLQVLHPRLFAGLYLDDIFTRLTFQLWPPALPPPSEQAGTLSAAAPAEVTP